MTPGDFVPILSSMAGASTVCIGGMVARGGVPAPLMAGHPMSGLAQRGIAARNFISTDGPPGAAGTAAQQMFNLGKLQAQFGVSEHGKQCYYHA